MPRVYIEAGSQDYYNLFTSFGFEVVAELPFADLVCFTGGADVSPALYNAKTHQLTHPWPARDAREQALFKQCMARNIPMVGVCRGGQFLNVMSGGSMYQDVGGHVRPHLITDVESGSQIWVSSTHHQMMMPGPDAEVVAYASLGQYREWYEGTVFKRDNSNTDYEVLFYPSTNALCFQPHPEFAGKDYEGMQEYFFRLIKEKLNVQEDTAQAC